MLSMSRAVLSPYLLPLPVVAMCLNEVLFSDYNERFEAVRKKFEECNATASKNPVVAKALIDCEKTLPQKKKQLHAQHLSANMDCAPKECMDDLSELRSYESTLVHELAVIGNHVSFYAKWYLGLIVANNMGRALFSGLRRDL